MKISEEIPPELLVPLRIARTNMVNTMAASIDFKDKVQREHFLKAKKSAIAALGAIDIADNVELFEKTIISRNETPRIDSARERRRRDP